MYLAGAVVERPIPVEKSDVSYRVLALETESYAEFENAQDLISDCIKYPHSPASPKV